MQLRFIKEDAYNRLLGSTEVNLSWYNARSASLSELEVFDEDIGTSSIDVDSFSLVAIRPDASVEARNENDLINMRIVHGAWKKLTPLQAGNRFMWTYYTHADSKIHDYIVARWGDGRLSEEQARDLFFVTGGRRNLVRGNALSSLWWKGHLTYDSAASNPYWIAERLATTTNLADFLDTFNSYNITRAKGVARAVAEVIDEKKLDSLQMKPFRALNKYLNRYSAVAPLDFLSEDEIRIIAKSEFERIVSS